MKKFALLIAALTVCGVALTPVTADASGSGQRHERAKAAPYKVTGGTVFNQPSAHPMLIQSKMVGAIDHAGKHSIINVMTWNYKSAYLTNALVRAHHRGATVRVIMARTLVNPNFRELTNKLKWHNAGRQGRFRSFTRTCNHSCRGTKGSMHSKWMTISQSGATKDIIMEGSANFTSSAATVQYNDWYTVVGNDVLYNDYRKVFDQALKDKPASVPDLTDGFRKAWFSPRSSKSDVVMDLLNKVVCTGATGGTGANGKTVVRIASAVIQGSRGERIARRIKQLVKAHCNVRVLYTLSTHTVLDILKGVPVRHMAWDTDGDGLFDKYMHIKAMSISGHVGSNTAAHVMFNGSANWSGMGAISDEQGFIVTNASMERRYTKYINWMWPQAARLTRVGARTFARSADGSTTLLAKHPYAKIRRALVG